MLSPRALCQVESVRVLCLCYLNYAAVEGDSVFDYRGALLSMLTEGRDLKKPVHLQIVSVQGLGTEKSLKFGCLSLKIFEAVQVLTNSVEPLEPAVLDSFMDMFG